MNSYMIITFVLTFVILMAIQIIFVKWKTNVILKLLQEQQFDKLEKELNNTITKAFLPRFNVEYVRLNSYLLQNKADLVEKQLDVLMKIRKSKMQEANVLMMAFNYYVEKEDKEKCHYYLNEIAKLNNDQMYRDAKIMSDIFIDKKANHIDELLNKIDTIDDHQAKAVYYYMIAKQYENMNDRVNSLKYMEMAQKNK